MYEYLKGREWVHKVNQMCLITQDPTTILLKPLWKVETIMKVPSINKVNTGTKTLSFISLKICKSV